MCKNLSIEAAMKKAKASIELEGFNVTKEHDELVRKSLNDELTHEQFMEEAKQLAAKRER
ncbi:MULTISPECIES: hypothetical protein [Pontibacillus]|uniref:Antitoxin VbhA domain-containing protein n=1 Tax=Pontibacillus chungwhensis TaxID=265426 RepID=A0ABY8V328_9BACI|nr:MULTISPECIES: hypothetical protein [Pontibacillus]MCD5322107.1 hypothetical protein [Pontibacillus sp. HN14]WIF99406.1 hypothetical protein QNI29_07035 [Pontibacillus chungwhensis]